MKKTNKAIAAGLAATTLIALSLNSTYAMGGGGGQGFGKTLTPEQRTEIQSMSDDERQEYVTELKEESGYTNESQGGMSDEDHAAMEEEHKASLDAIPASDLSDGEKEILSYGYSEELLARDVYSYLAELYPEEEVFAKIADSEQKHMDSVEGLLEKYNLEVPTNYGELDETYNALISEGKLSLKDALEVGLKIESLDITDIINEIKNTDNEDLITVFTNIGGASYNHMRSFLQAFEANGLTPDTDTSEFLSADDLDAKGPLKYKLAERLEAEGVVLPEQVNSETLKAKGPNSDSHGNSSSTHGKSDKAQSMKNSTTETTTKKMKGKTEDYKNTKKVEKTNNVENVSSDYIEMKNEYQKTYEEKYGDAISAMTDDQLNSLIEKIDELSIKINDGDYSDDLKEKYNAMLDGLKQVALDNLDTTIDESDDLIDSLLN